MAKPAGGRVRDGKAPKATSIIGPADALSRTGAPAHLRKSGVATILARLSLEFLQSHMECEIIIHVPWD